MISGGVRKGLSLSELTPPAPGSEWQVHGFMHLTLSKSGFAGDRIDFHLAGLLFTALVIYLILGSLSCALTAELLRSLRDLTVLPWMILVTGIFAHVVPIVIIIGFITFITIIIQGAYKPVCEINCVPTCKGTYALACKSLAGCLPAL